MGRRRPPPLCRRLRNVQLREGRSPADGKPRLARELRDASGSRSNHDASPCRRERGLASLPLVPEPDTRDALHSAAALSGWDVLWPRAVPNFVPARGVQARRIWCGSEAAHDRRAVQPSASAAAPARARLVGRVHRASLTPGRRSDSSRPRAVRCLGRLSRISLHLGPSGPTELTARLQARRIPSDT